MFVRGLVAFLNATCTQFQSGMGVTCTFVYDRMRSTCTLYVLPQFQSVMEVTLYIQCTRQNEIYMCMSCTVIQVCCICVGNKWLQQQIPACRPVFTAKHVFVLFLAVGIVFLVLGIVFVTVTVGVCSCTF